MFPQKLFLTQAHAIARELNLRAGATVDGLDTLMLVVYAGAFEFWISWVSWECDVSLMAAKDSPEAHAMIRAWVGRKEAERDIDSCF